MVTTIKKLDVLIKTLFPPGRKYIVPSEISLEPIVQLIQLISLCYPDYSLKNIIFYLLNTEISSFTIDNLAPERFIIAFRSFISLMDSREGQKPPFPLENDALPSGLMALRKLLIPEFLELRT
jgi:hypothetical protein